jgi:hypothetical protein
VFIAVGIHSQQLWWQLAGATSVTAAISRANKMSGPRERSPAELLGIAMVIAVILGAWYFGGEAPHARLGWLRYLLH